MSRIELLAAVPMFEGLDEADLRLLAGELRVHHFVPGDTIFHKGDIGDSMYIVASGSVNIHLPGASPVSHIALATLAAGTCFGEIALFDNKPRSASAVATSDTLLLELGRESFVKCIETSPNVAIAIIRTESERLRETTAKISASASRNAAKEAERSMTWSDRLADRVSAFNGSWTFLLILTAFSVVWALCNIPGVLGDPAPDRYPYIFYNLVIAVFIALQWPLIVMVQNRTAAKERTEAEIDFKVNLKNETNCEALLAELREFRREWEGHEEELEGLLVTRAFSMVPPPPSKPGTDGEQ